ncbi:ABC transporter ATP-binding protein [Rhizobium halophytocola]|uniref:ABC transport system ATP-binding protein n=1 Tax=Rhizobium halophytocola TaxID=735519 RepID=A0ABS4E0A7_9HYPH|nr:ATP-binding cassette domain-containing protein [Rhizobium halophytocola]MBP1851372.1 putative ABC transport system ATP-binding protein [Rhizobium halophytocola]
MTRLDLSLEDARVSFAGLAAPVLEIDRLAITAGEHVCITGASGSGKSTLVNIITGLEGLRHGRVLWSDTDLATLSEGRRDRWRAENVGLVMQDFHLFPGLSALDNVLLPARLGGQATKARQARAGDLLQRFGLERPDQAIETMSRGEMQRVAVARALLRQPGVIVADEPTASLDRQSGSVVADLLLDVAAAEGSTLIVVSHDPRLIDRLPRRIELASGRIAADRREAVAA